MYYSRYCPNAHSFKPEEPWRTRLQGICTGSYAHAWTHVHGPWQHNEHEIGRKKLAWASCTGRGFLLLGKWLRLRFFLATAGYQGSVCVHVCVCVCVCMCVGERLSTNWQLLHLNCRDFSTSPQIPERDASPWWRPQFSFPCWPPRLSLKS